MVQDTELATRASEADGSGPHFLGDQPCTDPDRIRFGHEVYVAALQDVAALCPTPFVIGLYGRWGTGKTTVLQGLRTALQKGPSRGRDFRVCLFDAWKYSEEPSFRRQFLVELNKQLSLGWDLDSLLYRPKEEQKVDVSALRHNLGTGFSTAVAVTLGLLLAYWALRLLIGAQLASVLIAAAAGGILTIVMFLVGIVFDLIKMSTYRVTHPLIFAPEQFEEQFREMLRKAKITDDRRLVVLVDNLDRCAPYAAVSALKTIKTFLEHEGCVFVVACDEHALIRHLTRDKPNHEEPEPEDEAKEFLRKFFQTTIEVQPLADDLRDFASELVTAAGLQPRVANVLWAASPRDPRRILQFLNRLTLALYVIKAREATGRLRPGVVSENQAYLAKLLWLTENWADFMSECVSDPELLRLADQTIMYPRMAESDPRWSSYLGPAAREGQYKDLHRFLQATLPVREDDPRPFLALQMPRLDMEIDEATAFSDALAQGLAGEIADQISVVSDASRLLTYREKMTRAVEQELRDGHHVYALNASRVAVHCFGLLPEPRRDLAQAICRVLLLDEAATGVPTFDQPSLVKCITQAGPILAGRATETVLQSLDHKSPHTDELLQALQEQSNLLDASLWGAVGDFLLATLSEVPDTALRYLNAIDQESEAATILFQKRPNILAQLAAMIVRAEAGLADRALHAFGRLRKHADSGAMNQLCTGVTGLLSAPAESRVEGYLARATAALDYLDLGKTSGELMALLDIAIRAAIGEPRPVEETAWLLAHLLRLYALESEPQQQGTLGLITSLALSWPPDKLTLLGDAIWQAEIEPARTAFAQAAADRGSDPQRSSEDIDAVLTALASLSADPDLKTLGPVIARVLQSPDGRIQQLGAKALSAHADRLPGPQRGELLRALYRAYTALPAPEGLGLLVHLVQVVDAQSPTEIKNGLGDRLKIDMTDGDASVRQTSGQQYALLRSRARLSQATRKNVAQDLADGLYELRQKLTAADRPLFDLVLDEQGNPRITLRMWRSLADTIESLLHSQHAQETRHMACNLIEHFDRLPEDMKEGILEQLEAIAGDETVPQAMRDDALSATRAIGKPTQ